MIDKRKFLFSATAFLSAFALSPTAIAHRLKTATSRVTWRDDDESLEITHILHLHDAEQALTHQGLLQTPDLTPLKARALFALYVEKYFSVSDISETPIPLETLGAEIQRGHIYVYQEANLDTQPQGLIIENTLLLDVFREQVNMVNVNLSGAIKTLQFEHGDKPKTVLA